MIVKLRRHRFQFRQIIPRNRRQIMVLIVIAHVEREKIDRAVITVGLLVRIVCVMLLNPARAHRVEPDRKEKRKHEIKKSGPATKINHRHVVGSRAEKIHDKPAVPERDRLQPWRPSQLEKRKQHQPDRFAIPFVADQPRLPVVRKIGIPFVVALMRMMLEMVNAKTHRAGAKVGKISDNADHFVPVFTPKNQIMRRIMNDDVIAVVRERSHSVRDQRAQPPITASRAGPSPWQWTFVTPQPTPR